MLRTGAVVESTSLLERIRTHILFDIQGFTDESSRINVEDLQILYLRFVLHLREIYGIHNARKRFPRSPELHERIEQGVSLVVLVGQRIHGRKQHSRVAVAHGIGLFGILDGFGILLFTRKDVYESKISAVCVFRLALQLANGFQQVNLRAIAVANVIFVLANKAKHRWRTHAIFIILLVGKCVGTVTRHRGEHHDCHLFVFGFCARERIDNGNGFLVTLHRHEAAYFLQKHLLVASRLVRFAKEIDHSRIAP